MIDDKNFGNRLTECMKIAGYTNSKLTEELSLSKNAVGNYKNNQIPNATILYNISQLLGTTMEYLLTGKHGNENLTDEEKNIILENHKIRFLNTETMIDLFEETAKAVAEYLGTTYNQTEADAAKEYFRWVLVQQN